MKIMQPKPQNQKYYELISNMENGIIKIPKFQRDFVWELQKSADLLDSILKGYPIGTIIIWKTKDRLHNIKKLGNVNLPDTPSGEYTQYILDGQQRLTSLFIAKKGLQIKKENKTVDYKNIFVNLDNVDDSEPIVSINGLLNPSVTVYELLNEGITFFTKKYPEEYWEKIETFQKSFENYDFSTIIIDDYPIEKATDIFNRINTTGTELSLFEIMVAKTYDEGKSFDLGEKYKKLEEMLSEVSYTIPTAQLLQCISMNLKNECTRKTILHIPKEEIIDVWDDTVTSIKSAIDHFKDMYKIPVSNLLPYPALVVPFSYFFFKNKKNPTLNQDKYLQEYFWKSALTSRFSSAVETKLAQDGKIIDTILDDQVPFFDKDFKVTITKEDIQTWPFSAGESISKSVMCVLAFCDPKSFDINKKITLDNSYLIRGNSKNYHHFFPKAFLKKQGVNDVKINVLPNITLVDDFLNKRKIKARAPSDYMHEFRVGNPSLAETMKTHLIDNLEDYGIWKDDYNSFIDKRSQRIFDELKKRFNRD